MILALSSLEFCQAFKVQIHFYSANDKHKKRALLVPLICCLYNYFFSTIFASPQQAFPEAAQLFFCDSAQPVVAAFSVVFDLSAQQLVVVTSFFVSFFLSSLLVAAFEAEIPKTIAKMKMRINFFIISEIKD
jgi:hypothetical protein